MTYNWLLIFEKNQVFEIGEKEGHPEEREIRLKNQVLSPNVFNRTENCLWTKCKNYS